MNATNRTHFKMAKSLPCMALLCLASLSCIPPVAGQSLEISFEKVGSYDYNNGKAFFEGDLVQLVCDIAGEIPSGHAVVFTRAKDASDTDLVKLTSAQTVVGTNTDNHLSVQHNVQSTDPTYIQNYKLSISDVAKYDQGFYKCRVENVNGGDVTATSEYTNTVTEKPQIVVLYLPDANRYPECIVDEGTTDVKLGATINIRCTSEFGNPMVSLNWKRNMGGGQIEDVQSTITMDPNVDNIEREIDIMASPITIAADHDGDIYTCFMNPNQEFFPQGLRSCEIGPLNIVSDVPLPTINPMVQMAIPGDTVSFQCALSGQPDAVFTWHWEPNWVFDKNPVSPDTATFSLKNARSYHHLTKVFCRTTSEGVEVSVYGLIRVNGDYEAPPNTPAPPVTFKPPTAGGGTDGGSGGTGTGTGGGSGGSGTGSGDGGANPTSASGGLNDGKGGSTRSSSGRMVVYETASIIIATCLAVLLSWF